MSTENVSGWTAVLGGKDFTSEVLDGDGEVLAFELSQAQANLIAAAPDMLQALDEIARLWPYPPNCANVEEVVGVNDGKARAILLKAALDISRATIAKYKETP